MEITQAVETYESRWIMANALLTVKDLGGPQDADISPLLVSICLNVSAYSKASTFFFFLSHS